MSDYGYNFVNKALSIVAGLITSVLLARYLGVALRGEFSFVTQTAGLLAIALGLGMNQAFPYFYRRNPVRGTYLSFVRIFLVQALAYGAIAVVISLIVRESTTSYLSLLAVAAVGYQQMESALAAVNVKLKIKVNIGLSVARIVLNGAMVLTLPASLFWPVMVQALLWVGAVVSYLIFTSAAFGLRPEEGVVGEVLRYSWLPMLTTALVILNYNVDTLMLKALGTPHDLGHYAVAAGLVTYMWVIPDAIKEVLVSRVVRSHDPRAILTPLRFSVAAALLTIVGFMAVGWWLVPFMFGEAFAPSYHLGFILSLGVISMTYYKIIGVLLLAEGRRVFYFATLATAVLSNIGLNFTVIPTHGATGAAWVSVVTYSVTGLAFVAYFCRSKSIGFSEVLTPTAKDLRAIPMSAFRRDR